MEIIGHEGSGTGINAHIKNAPESFLALFYHVDTAGGWQSTVKRDLVASSIPPHDAETEGLKYSLTLQISA